ncbi:MAG: PIN domain-containing protein [Blastocatellia bacterium]
MAIITYLDANCLIAIADAEPQRRGKVLALLGDSRRSFIYSPFTTLETLSLAIHYRKPVREQIFRRYLNRCAYISDNLTEILNEAHRQSEKYGIVGIDACHIAAAIVGLADEVYTFEKATKPMFRTKDVRVFSLL